MSDWMEFKALKCGLGMKRPFYREKTLGKLLRGTN